VHSKLLIDDDRAQWLLQSAENAANRPPPNNQSISLDDDDTVDHKCTVALRHCGGSKKSNSLGRRLQWKLVGAWN